MDIRELILTTSVIGDRVIMGMISLISVTILYVRSFMTAIDRSDLLMTLEDGYIDDFEDMS